MHGGNKAEDIYSEYLRNWEALHFICLTTIFWRYCFSMKCITLRALKGKMHLTPLTFGSRFAPPNSTGRSDAVQYWACRWGCQASCKSHDVWFHPQMLCVLLCSWNDSFYSLLSWLCCWNLRISWTDTWVVIYYQVSMIHTPQVSINGCLKT